MESGVKLYMMCIYHLKEDMHKYSKNIKNARYNLSKMNIHISALDGHRISQCRHHDPHRQADTGLEPQERLFQRNHLARLP
ncbi:hypothetical protein BGC30_04030 [Novacetimonas hansenii]|nr:hypothetical protein BGC30_04030 [Novacetimonas hansenii]